MARAKKFVPKKTHMIRLTLTEREASLITTWAGDLIAWDGHSYGKEAESIHNALVDAGVESVGDAQVYDPDAVTCYEDK